MWGDWVQPADVMKTLELPIGGLAQGSIYFGQFSPFSPDPGLDLSFYQTAWEHAQLGENGADTFQDTSEPLAVSPPLEVPSFGIGAGTMVGHSAAFFIFHGGEVTATVSYAGGALDLLPSARMGVTSGGYSVGGSLIPYSLFGVDGGTYYEFENDWGTIPDAEITALDFYNDDETPVQRWSASNSNPEGVTDAPFTAEFYAQRLYRSPHETLYVLPGEPRIPVIPAFGAYGWTWLHPSGTGDLELLGSVDFSQSSHGATGVPWSLPTYARDDYWLGLIVATDVMRLSSPPVIDTAGRLGNPAEPMGSREQYLAGASATVEFTVRPSRIRFWQDGSGTGVLRDGGAEFFAPRDS